MDVARVGVHYRLTQSTVVRWGDVEFALQNREILTAGEGEEGRVAAGRRRSWRGDTDRRFEAVRGAGQMVQLAISGQDHIAALTVPGCAGVKMALAGVVSCVADLAQERCL